MVRSGGKKRKKEMVRSEDPLPWALKWAGTRPNVQQKTKGYGSNRKSGRGLHWNHGVKISDHS